MTLPDRQQWSQLSPLLDELLELGPDERTVRLAAVRAGDAALADELQGLLGASQRAQRAGFMSGAAPHDAGTAADLAGEQIGAYVIEGALGQGGTGSVWRARRADGRYEGAVAVKLLHLSLIGHVGAQRFTHEGAILARLSHPHIAHLLDAGVTPRGQPYLVLELVQGERIDHHCNARRLDVAQRLALFDDVLAAVAHAHTHLVVHRDIKPNNILVGVDGSVKLLDFGIAKLLQDGQEGAHLTVDGQRAMTPGYAAPEQLQGGPITTATDVYALGVLLYQLLAGRHPTASDTASSAEIIRATVDTEPQRLALAPGTEQTATERNTSLLRLRRQLHGDLENIVAKALRKNPAERYQSAAALAEDLRRARAHEPVGARPDAWAYRGAKFLRRHRGAVAAGALVIVATAAGVAGTLTQAAEARAQATAARAAAGRADAQTRIAEQGRAQALKSLTRAEASDEVLRFVLSESSDEPVTGAHLLGRSAEVIERQFADDPGLLAYLQLQVADLYAENLNFGKAAEQARRARDAAQRAGDASLVAQIDCTLAGAADGMGKGEGAQALLDASVKLLQSGGDTEREALLHCLNERATHHMKRGHVQQTLADASLAVQLQGIPRPGRRAGLASLQSNLANAYAMSGEPARAITEYESAIAGLQQLGRGHTSAAQALANNLGNLLARAGLWQRSAAAYGQALALLPPDDLFGLQSLGPPYAKLLLLLGRDAEAMALAERALAAARRSGNPGPVAPTALAAGGAACAVHQLDLCAARLQVARSNFARYRPSDRGSKATLNYMAATLALQRHAPQQARALLLEALDLVEAVTEWNPLRTRTLTLLARTELQMGELQTAAAHAQEALANARSFARGLPACGWLGEALLAQALVQRAQGDAAAAGQSLREALVQLDRAGGPGAPSTQEAHALMARL